MVLVGAILKFTGEIIIHDDELLKSATSYKLKHNQTFSFLVNAL